jgi:hypothetical protein
MAGMRPPRWKDDAQQQEEQRDGKLAPDQAQGEDGREVDSLVVIDQSGM